MNRAFRTTLLMGLVTAVTVVVAGVVYPWPEVVATNKLEGTKLFPDFDEGKVRGIKVVKVDADRSVIEQFQVLRNKESWTIPSAADYPAGNTQRIASITDAFADREVLTVPEESEQQESHLKFGVLDPEAPTSSDRLSGIGQKVIVSDINGRPLGSMIVGIPVRGEPSQRYVRIQDQPTVYVINFQPAMLSTAVSDWVDTNLLNLATRNNQGGRTVRSIKIENYIIEEEKLATADYTKSTNYHIVIQAGQQDLKIDKLWVEKDGELVESTERPSLRREVVGELSEKITFILFSTVAPKPVNVAESIRAASFLDEEPMANADDFQQTIPAGFRWSKLENGEHQFDCANGRVILTTNDGLRFTINIGSIVKGQEGTGQEFKMLMMLNASVDPEQFPMPDPIADDASDKQKRDFAIALQKRKLEATAAQTAADEFNKRMTQWYFLIDENIVNAIRPDIDKLTK